ncbi:MAG: hypothetical protein PHG31_01760 [Candidatus Omnitrophica bacterium]|nr:hypothetical protein [Candidatus Omnitrophota bacterium]
MSIIYEALKKLGTHPAQPKGQSGSSFSTQKAKNKQIAVYIMLAIVGMFIAKKGFDYLFPPLPIVVPALETTQPLPAKPDAGQAPALPSPAPAVVVVENETIPQVEPREQYVLNGIFSSGNDNYALVNNQIVRLGENVDGATVEKITVDSVELNTLEGQIILTNRR